MGGEGFRARLIPLDHNGEAPRVEYSDFGFDEVNEGDLQLVTPGAIFYWTLARRTNEAGTVENASLVTFRRLPAPDRHLAKHAEDAAEGLWSALRADEST